MNYKALKGTKDVLPEESYQWQYIEEQIRKVCALFGLREIRTPVIEHTELFLRGVGDTTDIVQKEMYTFTDRGDRSITLKPEGTGGAVRSFIENSMYNDAQPTKMYYLNCPVFRYERPQAGRLREHHQFGIEIFGSQSAYTDAEVILVALTVLKQLGIQGLKVNINSIGCPNCRPEYNRRLKEYFAPHLDKMCHDCQERFERNPLRLLDCKEEACKEIAKNPPTILDSLCSDCKEHFEQHKACLSAMGIEYDINPRIVRGLDYYSKTVFEIISTHIGSQGTVCGGGRYDGLIEMFGGPKTPGIGFGMGMERLLLVMQAQGIEIPKPIRMDAYIVPFGDTARGVEIAMQLREQGIRADFDPLGRSVKAQMRYAEKCGARYVLFEGEEERNNGVFKLKNMQDGTESVLKELDAVELLKRGND